MCSNLKNKEKELNRVVPWEAAFILIYTTIEETFRSKCPSIIVTIQNGTGSPMATAVTPPLLHKK